MNVWQPIENKTTRLNKALYRLFGSSINKRRPYRICIQNDFGSNTKQGKGKKNIGFMSEHIVVPIHRLDQEKKNVTKAMIGWQERVL